MLPLVPETPMTDYDEFFPRSPPDWDDMRAIAEANWKKKARAKCRARWGKDWYRGHPLIKQARLQWAIGKRLSDKVHVTEADGTEYTV